MGQNIIARIKQMMAKAESTEFAEEADAIMEMVGRLMEAHGISLLQVADKAQELDPVEVDRDAFGFYASENWTKKLSHAVGRYYGVNVIWFRRRNWTETAICGRESCRAAYTAMMPYLVGQVRRLASAGAKNGHFSTTDVAKREIGNALCFRLWDLIRKREQAPAPKVASGMNMLVPVDEIEAATKQAFPDMRVVDVYRRTNRVSQEAVDAAAKINLADQLNKKDTQVRALR